MKKIKEIEELTNFNVKKNICLNCLEKLIKNRENLNNGSNNETESLKYALANLMSEMESDEFSN